MSPLIRAGSALVLLGLAVGTTFWLLSGVPGEKPDLAPSQGEDDLTRAVRQLGDKDFKVREKATAQLLQAGKAARPALRKALGSDDPEVVRRARAVLDQIQHRIPPGTPKETADLLTQYYADHGQKDIKSLIISDLRSKGLRGLVALLDLSDDEEDERWRGQIREALTHAAPELVAFLIAEGRVPEAERWLEQRLSNQAPMNDGDALREDKAAEDYAVFLMLYGRPDDKTRTLREQVERSGNRRAATILAYLYRARGDLAKARRPAEKAGNQTLLALLQVEQGNW